MGRADKEWEKGSKSGDLEMQKNKGWTGERADAKTGRKRGNRVTDVLMSSLETCPSAQFWDMAHV